MKVALSTLGEEATIIMGQSPPGDSYNREGKGPPLLNGPSEFGPDHPQEVQWTTSPTKFCQTDDVLFCVRGATAGRLNIADKEYCIGRGLAAIRGKAGKFDNAFLKHVLANGYARFQSRGVGSTFINISAEELKRFPVPSLPLSEQRRLAATLDLAEALRTRRCEALAKLDTLTQSLFLEMFGDPATNPKAWPLIPLLDLWAEPPVYGTMIPPTDTGKWLSLRVANIQDGQLNLDDRKYVDLPGNVLSRHSLKDGDLVLARAIASQEHLGKCVVVETRGECWAFDSHLMRLRLNPSRIQPKYLSALLRTKGGRSLFLAVSRRSAVQFNVNTGEMGRLIIPLPPIHLQNGYVSNMEQIAEQAARMKEQLSTLSLSFDSLQHRAFRGEL